MGGKVIADIKSDLVNWLIKKIETDFFIIRPYKEATVKISHLGLIDKTGLIEAIEKRNFVGDSNRDNIEEKEQKKFQNVSSMSNKEIHNLLEEEVNRIKENKTKSIF